MLQKQTENSNRFTEMSCETYAQRDCDNYNQSMGTLEGYDCPECKNRGRMMVVRDGYPIVKYCKCMEIRNTMQRLKSSGLKDLIENYTFERFKVQSEWQRKAKAKAIEFLKDHENKWFFMGGQVGCGKTHLCTALVLEFIKAGNAAHYMLWRDEIVPLKASIMDEEAYEKAVRKLKEIKVLYIDDFFKTERGKTPTTSEINITFEILNYRYNNRDLVTIISSEWLIDDIIGIDEAVGSRIYERSIRHCLVIPYDNSKNYRLNGGVNCE